MTKKEKTGVMIPISHVLIHNDETNDTSVVIHDSWELWERERKKRLRKKKMMMKRKKTLTPLALQGRVAKFEAPLEDIKFPFRWQYGRITELSQKDREDLNMKHANGRKIPFCERRHCDLCDSLGITHRKKSDGTTTSLLCSNCAKDYVTKARWLEEKWEELAYQIGESHD